MESSVKIIATIVVVLIIALALSVAVTNRIKDTERRSGDLSDNSQGVLDQQSCKLKCESCALVGKTGSQCDTGIQGCACT